jgi:hypothetical protein
MNYVSYGDTNISDDDMKAYNEAKELLAEGGRYSVHDENFLTGANISVCLTSDFMEAVENNDWYELRFPDVENYDEDMKRIYNEEWQQCGDVREWEARGYGVKVYHRIKAKELWKLINICVVLELMERARPSVRVVGVDHRSQLMVAHSVGPTVGEHVEEDILVADEVEVAPRLLKRCQPILDREQRESLDDACPVHLERNLRTASEPDSAW